MFVNILKVSFFELCFLLVIIGFVMVVFVSVVYYLERYDLNSDFRSVFESMWWVVIIMIMVSFFCNMCKMG